MLASWLDWCVLLWFHPPNEARRSARLGAELKRQGMRAGVPDVLIFDPPPLRPGAPGVAIELKPPIMRGEKKRRPTEAQQSWLAALAARGWLVFVCYGAADAIECLTDLGYGPRG